MINWGLSCIIYINIHIHLIHTYAKYTYTYTYRSGWPLPDVYLRCPTFLWHLDLCFMCKQCIYIYYVLNQKISMLWGLCIYIYICISPWRWYIFNFTYTLGIHHESLKTAHRDIPPYIPRCWICIHECFYLLNYVYIYIIIYQYTAYPYIPIKSWLISHLS